MNIRKVLNAIFYLLRSGCAWRMLPHDFLPWQTVYGYFRAWRKDGIWEQMNDIQLRRVKKKRFKRLKLIWADGGYSGQPMRDWAMALAGWLFEVVKRSDDTKGFVVLPKRWIVERTFAWLGLIRFR